MWKTLKTLKNSKKWQKSGLFVYFLLTGWGIFWVLTWFLLISGNNKLLSQTAPIPNFDEVTFSDLLPLTDSGSIEIPTDLLGELNYNPNRQWNAGQVASEIFKLGDFQDSFQLQNFSLREISQLSGLSLTGIRLSDLGLVNHWTLEDVVTSLPQIGSLSVNQVPLIGDLLEAGGVNISNLGSRLIRNLINDPNLANLPLESLNLGQYGLNDLPSLTQSSLSQLTGWADATIAEIPLLSEVPFSQFTNAPLIEGGGIGQIDLILGTAEQSTYQALSGSYEAGFNANCSENCAHIELGGNPLVAGKQWVSGQYQKVEGGFGVLQSLFGGVEPTGRHPFGNSFKVAIWDVDETTDTITTAWFFRICIRRPFDLGCSPYGIGPIPSFPYGRDEWIFLGI